MSEINKLKSERGNIWGMIVLWIIILIVVGAGGYLIAISSGWVPVPPGLANQSWMQGFLPQNEEEQAPQLLEMSIEDTLRQQVLILNSQLAASDARVKTLEEEVAGKQREIQQRDDTIAQLQDTINLSRTQNISNVALIYENMEARDAATILSNLGAERASLILGKMRESKAADVLALMEQTLATQITQLMAGFETGQQNPSSTLPPPATSPGRPGPSVGPPAGSDM